LVPSSLTTRPLLLPLSIVLALCGLYTRWQHADAARSIDFFTVWSVARVAVQRPGIDFYDEEQRSALGRDLRRAARARSVPPRLRASMESSLSINREKLDATGSPFLYALVGLLSSGDYDVDRRRFLAVSLGCLVMAVWLLGRRLAHPPPEAFLFCTYAVLFFSPVDSDSRVGNLNQILLLAVAAYVHLAAWGRLLTAGMILGAGIVFKPTIASIFVFTLVRRALLGDVRALLRECSGVALAVAAGVVFAAFYFGRASVWLSFAKSLPGTLDLTYPFAAGNLGLPMLVRHVVGWRVALPVLVVVLAAFAAAVWRGRSASGGGKARSATVGLDAGVLPTVGLACAAMVLSSNLVWLHYYTLVLPLMLYLLGPATEPVGGRRRTRFAREIAVVALLLFSPLIDPFLGDALGTSVALNAATLLLVAVVLPAIAFPDAGVAEPGKGGLVRVP
jgi:hypothetical protein